MSIEITKYLNSVLDNSSFPVIPFKDDNFISLTYEELLKSSFNINSTHKLSSLLNPVEYNKIFGVLSKKELKKSQTVQIGCIISYKTLKTEFIEQLRVKRNIPELTGVFYINFSINFTRICDGAKVTYEFNKDCLPWYSRSFMSPIYLNSVPIVANIDDVDKYKSNTTEKRAKICTWNDYINYCNDMFKDTANLQLKYENKCFVFKHDTNRELITGEISKLYKKIIDDNSNHILYNNFVNVNFTNSSSLINNNDIFACCSHCGQMNGEFPLSDSQRQAVHHMNSIDDGEILAVSGPPGTGKTTLLQSIVADMVVKRALASQDPPVIVATSANNQAVTNIIDSFSNIRTVNKSNLEQRWINGVKSFATYMPSSAKEDEANKNGYQYTTVFKREFIQEAENSIENSIQKMKNCAKSYFGKEFSNIDDVKNELSNELSCIDDLKNQLLNISADITKLTDGTELVTYIKLLKQSKSNLANKIDTYKKRVLEWKNIYKKINIFKRLFSFIPVLKKQISVELSIELLPEETEYFNKDITFYEINNVYASKILDKSEKINSIEKKIQDAEQFETSLLDILKKLKEKGCCLELLSNITFSKFDVSDIDNLIDTKIRYIEFWIAVHINECRFLKREFTVKEKQRGKTFKNVLKKFYKQIALISPCFVMTVYKMPSNFKSYDDSYLFDYVDLLIFDEAGQCSPEIASPQFSLAKKAIVVGDEYQIPPVYNIDSIMDITLAIQNNVVKNDTEFEKFSESGLSCSQGSVMTIAKKSCKYNYNNIRGLFLCEHRRCYDEIISYCNKLVYNGLLHPMRNKEERDKKKQRILKDSLYPLMGYHNIQSLNSKCIGTSRINEIEANSIAKWLNKNYNILCSLYHADSSVDTKNILAIITPFSAQAAVIREALHKEMKEESDTISVGTVHAFQGAEKNIIIFSTVYGSNDSGFFIDNNKNLMNVAVSRAKDAFWVFGDIDFLKGKSLQTASGLLYNEISINEIC